MKIRSKLAIIIAPILLASIVVMNVIFNNFFQDYVHGQESARIDTVRSSVVSYLEENESKYLGNVNDWAHWDDMYLFSQNKNPNFEKYNLMESTFTNLDINFLAIAKKSNVQYEKYFSSKTDSFTDFPQEISAEFGRLLRSLKNWDDNYGIYNIGDKFYFIAVSEISDSMSLERSDYKLVFGKQIDADILTKISKTTGCEVGSIKTVTDSAIGVHTEPFSYKRNSADDQGVIDIEVLVPNTDLGVPVSIELDFKRDMLQTSISKITSFSFLNTLFSVAFAAFIFFLLGRFLTKPFVSLIKDVKNIDHTDTKKLEEKGHDEFNYVRKTINHFLDGIENAQNELKDNKEKLQATLLSVGDGVVSVDKNGIIQFLNPAAQALTGWTMQDALNKPFGEIFYAIDEKSGEPVESPVNNAIETETVLELSNHILLVSKDGTKVPIENTAAPIRDRNAEIIGCVLVFRNVSERREKQKHIEYLSYHDQLTGLYNRRFFEEELVRLDVPENLPLSFLYIDVNGLKTVNDAFGHQVGDDFINRISDAIKSISRSCDMIARIGGDEFVMVLPKTIASGAEQIAMFIKESVSKIRIMDFQISISIGWGTKNSPDMYTLDVLKQAEDLMYSKKIFNSTTKRSGIIQSILNSLLIKNPRENAHSKRVSEICAKIGEAFYLSDDEIKELKIIGELHDIGKIAIDETILNKAGGLTEDEWSLVKKHPETGYRLLGTSNEFTSLAEYILSHHERWDGKGYPRGLKGKEIPWQARVIAVADSYDAMTSDRPYRKALSEEEATAQLQMNSGSQFDPEIVRIFINKVLKTL